MSTSPRKALLLTLPLILSAAVVHAQEAQDAGALVRQADGELDTDLDAAIFDYTAAIRLDGSIPEAFHGRGWARRKKGDLDGAIDDLTEALRLRPGFVKALLTRADAYEQKLDFVAAIADLDEVVRLEPASSESRRRRGTSKCLKGDLDGAIDDHTAALGLDPRNTSALLGRAYVRDLKGDFERAIADYSEAIRVDPGSAKAYAYRAQTKEHAKDTAGAFADYTQAIKLRPDADAYSRRGRLSFAGGDMDKAIADATEAIRLAPDFTLAYEQRAAASYQTVDDDGMIWDYGESIRSKPTPDALRWRSSAHAFKGSCAEALADAERMLALFPKDWRSYDARAKVRALTGDRKNALSDLMTAAELGKDQVQPRVWILGLGGNVPDLIDVVTAQHGEWYWTAIRFFVGTIEASQLLDDAGGKTGKLCVARWAIGFKAESNGDLSKAKDSYEACVATKQTSLYEWRWARARLRVLAREQAGPAVATSDGWKWDPRTSAVHHVGDRARELVGVTSKLVRTTTTDGTVRDKREQEETFRYLATTEIVAVDSSMSVTEKLVRIHRWKLLKDQRTDTSLEGHVIRLKREGRDRVCIFEDDKEGRISREAKEWAEKELGEKSTTGALERGDDAGERNPTLPKEPVGNGATWKFDVASIAKDQEGWDPERSSGTGTLTGVSSRGGIHYGRIERKASMARTDLPWKNGGIVTISGETSGSLEPDKDRSGESSMQAMFEDLAEIPIPGQGLAEFRESAELRGWQKVWPVEPDGR